MKTIGAGEFKAKCLQLMDEVAEKGESLIVTKHGRPVVEIKPARAMTLSDLPRGHGSILGDIISPVDVAWEAEG